MAEVPPGLSTTEALRTLHCHLQQALQDHLLQNRWQSLVRIARETWSHRSTVSVFQWPAAVMVMAAGIVMVTVGLYCGNQQPRFVGLTAIGLVLLLVCLLNCCLVLREAFLRQTEMPVLVEKLLQTLADHIPSTAWAPPHYPHRHSPLSPCISLQWTVRDGATINLPAALLVEGDTVMLRPGQKLLADCVPLMADGTPNPNVSSKLFCGSTYSPPVEGIGGEALTSPKVRIPNVPKPYRLTHTPFVGILETVLSEALQRPVSIYQKQRNVIAWVMEVVLVPVLLVISMGGCLLRLYYGIWCSTGDAVDNYSISNGGHSNYYSGNLSANNNSSNISDSININNNKVNINSSYNQLDPLIGDILEATIVVPVSIIVPLLPILLPVVWTVFNTVATAIIIALYQSTTSSSGRSAASRRPATHEKGGSSGDSSRSSSVGSQGCEDGDAARLCPPPADSAAGAVLPALGGVRWRAVWRQVWRLARGDVETCIRGSNLLHVLASVTNLCCVDKKGVLSWANPTAEKLFFLRNKGRHFQHAGHARSSTTSLATHEDVFMQEQFPAPTAPHKDLHNPSSPTESDTVLLSLTHDRATPFGLSFDEPVWKSYLGSLKPLGLSVLLNTCHQDTQAHYTAFCGHLTNEASYTQDLVPVSQRRCLCELARQIGFLPAARHPFSLEHQLSVFRHVPSELACKGGLARSLMVSKLKFPFPHMVAVLMRDTATHKLELLTQGTADIVLDSCSDYWDGADLSPLTDKDRKKLLDFYHRTSLSAYCTAFSYRPSPCVVKTDLTKLYMELPTDPTHLYTRSPTPHNSTEALYGDEAHTEYELVEDIDDLFRMQCKQIFIAMVTMQYHAKADMVQMIEQLDSACIRFVHFSKENELRSRVFSEKMGLESGWNCHISLLDDRNKEEESLSSGSRAGQHSAASARTSGLSLFRTSNDDVTIASSYTRSKTRSLLERSKMLSHSAPSAINLDAALVKFDDEVSICSSASSSSLEFDQSNLHYEGSGSELRHGLCPLVPSAKDGDDHRHPPHHHHPNTTHDSSIHSLSPHPSQYSPCHTNIHSPRHVNSPLCGVQSPHYSPHYSHSPQSSYHSQQYSSHHHSPQLARRYSPCCSPANKPRCGVAATNRHETGSVSAADKTSCDGTDGGATALPPADRAAQHATHHDAPQRHKDDFDVQSRAPSQVTESSEHSTCFNFDMSNRAQLPKGINNIRPHLKDVDNVPLLVSLFTDCTTSATQQMLEIMQDNSEVVLLMGSSANIDNVPLFARTDASLGVEPSYPVVCMREPVLVPPPPGVMPPTQLATRLHTLPCALTFALDGPLAIVALIEKSRDLLQCTSNSLQFWAGCSCSLAFLQLLALFFLLPPALHAGDVLWLVLVSLPLLSVSLLAGPHNPELMKQATGKNTMATNVQLFQYVATHYGSKFLPSLVMAVVCTALALRGMCDTHLAATGHHSDSGHLSDGSHVTLDSNTSHYSNATLNTSHYINSGSYASGSQYYSSSDSSKSQILSPLDDSHRNSLDNKQMASVVAMASALDVLNATAASGPDGAVASDASRQCFYVYQLQHDDSTGTDVFSGWGPQYAASLRCVQVYTAFLLLLYMCIISVSFVHRMSQVWKRNPFTNRVWATTVPALLLLQALYSWAVCSGPGLTSVPAQSWLPAGVWAMMLLPLNEMLKRREIRANVRYQKRARLEFGTKLGMNSPF